MPPPGRRTPWCLLSSVVAADEADVGRSDHKCRLATGAPKPGELVEYEFLPKNNGGHHGNIIAVVPLFLLSPSRVALPLLFLIIVNCFWRLTMSVQLVVDGSGEAEQEEVQASRIRGIRQHLR